MRSIRYKILLKYKMFLGSVFLMSEINTLFYLQTLEITETVTGAEHKFGRFRSFSEIPPV